MPAPEASEKASAAIHAMRKEGPSSRLLPPLSQPGYLRRKMEALPKGMSGEGRRNGEG
jgi:hypothetical protein